MNPSVRTEVNLHGRKRVRWGLRDGCEPVRKNEGVPQADPYFRIFPQGSQASVKVEQA